MIAGLRKSKAVLWIAGTLVIAMAAALLYLNSRNGELSTRVGNLQRQNDQLAETAQSLSREYLMLQQEIERRDELVARALEAKQTAERKARETINRLRQELADDPCANTHHPDVVGDSLRSGAGDRVQD